MLIQRIPEIQNENGRGFPAALERFQGFFLSVFFHVGKNQGGINPELLLPELLIGVKPQPLSQLGTKMELAAALLSADILQLIDGVFHEGTELPKRFTAIIQFGFF